jgi:16S rRNA (guanine527-N7)-methyltransferase
VVCARAVAQTGTIVEYAAPLLMKGGRLVVAKARPTDEELEVAKRVADMCGLRFVSRETLELAGERGHREIIVYERYANPRIKLPRKVGQAQHNPLGV